MKIAATILCLLLAVPALSAIDEEFEERDTFDEDTTNEDQESEDSDNAEDSDSEEEADSETSGVDPGDLTTRPTEFTGSVESSLGIAMSLVEWPHSDNYEQNSPFDYTFGYAAATTFEVDSRPKPHLRFNTRFGTKLDEQEMTFTSLSLDRLFIDYTVADNITFRAGRYAMTWGSARVLDNVTNLVDDVDDGIALRAVAPLGPGTLTAVAYSNEDWVADFGAQDLRAFAYAVLLEQTFDSLTATAGARARSAAYETPEDATTDITASVASSLGPFDLTVEAINRINRLDPWASQYIDFEVLSQALWEGGDPSWVVAAEHLFDYTGTDTPEHRVGVAVRMPSLSVLGVNWRPQVRARHSFKDNSGDLVTGLSGTPAPDLTVTIGMPLRYGPPGSHYREGTFGSDVQDLAGVAALGLSGSVSFTF